MYREQDVRAGMALLDEWEWGWEDRLDLDNLNLMSSDDCVLGQVFGDYGTGLVDLNIQTVGREYGFYSERALVGELQRTWRELVTQRRQEHSQPERELVTA